MLSHGILVNGCVLKLAGPDLQRTSAAALDRKLGTLQHHPCCKASIPGCAVVRQCVAVVIVATLVACRLSSVYDLRVSGAAA